MTQSVTGSVVQVDESGSLITDIDSERLANAPTDASLRVTVDEHETFGLYPPDHAQPAMTLIAITHIGTPLKIMLVDDSASAMLGVRVGAPVLVEW